MQSTGHIVDSDGPANIGDLWAIPYQIGELSDGYREAPLCEQQPCSRKELAHIRDVRRGWGICASATALTAPS
jgi:hypothetical protein